MSFDLFNGNIFELTARVCRLFVLTYGFMGVGLWRHWKSLSLHWVRKSRNF